MAVPLLPPLTTTTSPGVGGAAAGLFAFFLTGIPSALSRAALPLVADFAAEATWPVRSSSTCSRLLTPARFTAAVRAAIAASASAASSALAVASQPVMTCSIMPA
jgi:hypothetical protein